jgi:hypothetical protein
VWRRIGVERLGGSYEVGSIQKRGWGPESESTVVAQEYPPAQLNTWYDRPRILKSLPQHGTATELVAPDEPYGGICLGDLNELSEAVVEDEIIGRDYFAVLGCRRNEPECSVVVLDDAEELVVVVNSDPAVKLRVLLRDVERIVGAAVIDDDVFEMLERLAQNTLNAHRKKLRPIEDGRHHTHQRFFSHGYVFRV